MLSDPVRLKILQMQLRESPVAEDVAISSRTTLFSKAERYQHI